MRGWGRAIGWRTVGANNTTEALWLGFHERIAGGNVFASVDPFWVGYTGVEELEGGDRVVRRSGVIWAKSRKPSRCGSIFANALWG